MMENVNRLGSQRFEIKTDETFTGVVQSNGNAEKVHDIRTGRNWEKS